MVLIVHLVVGLLIGLCIIVKHFLVLGFYHTGYCIFYRLYNRVATRSGKVRKTKKNYKSQVKMKVFEKSQEILQDF